MHQLTAPINVPRVQGHPRLTMHSSFQGSPFLRAVIQTTTSAAITACLSLLTLGAFSPGSIACERHLHGHQGTQSSAPAPGTNPR
jgi:hypothetical protein